MVFDKSYLHDKTVEYTAENTRLANIKTQIEILSTYKKKFTDDAIVRFLNNEDKNIDSNDIEEAPEEITISQSGSPPKGSMPNPKNVDKREDELIRERNSGKPMGV
jgi:hypothetical protein